MPLVTGGHQRQPVSLCMCVCVFRGCWTCRNGFTQNSICHKFSSVLIVFFFLFFFLWGGWFKGWQYSRWGELTTGQRWCEPQQSHVNESLESEPRGKRRKGDYVWGGKSYHVVRDEGPEEPVRNQVFIKMCDAEKNHNSCRWSCRLRWLRNKKTARHSKLSTAPALSRSFSWALSYCRPSATSHNHSFILSVMKTSFGRSAHAVYHKRGHVKKPHGAFGSLTLCIQVFTQSVWANVSTWTRGSSIFVVRRDLNAHFDTMFLYIYQQTNFNHIRVTSKTHI